MRPRPPLVFVNTRSQAERTFQELWRINDDNLPIALHHGSLAPEQRRKVEAAMTRGSLRAVVCTSTLDLGIDWGAVDKVICIGAPKGAARLVQRIGRAPITGWMNPARRCLVPANRFRSPGMQRGPRCRAGGGTGWRAAETGQSRCSGPACPGDGGGRALCRPMILYRGSAGSASPYAATGTRRRFRCRGGFCRHRRLCAAHPMTVMRSCGKMPDGRLRLAHPRLAQQYLASQCRA